MRPAGASRADAIAAIGTGGVATRSGEVNVTPLSVPASPGASSIRRSSIHWR